ncbi:MAG: spermidine/putrescine ABC transporter permease [Anaerolineales bacterium]|nr:ABC transporter permease subunit [Anaerolineae bacterium]PWB69030.1 MAG: spermidine/putrescine ABC transporter permease [Anaerolineales bacterium]
MKKFNIWPWIILLIGMVYFFLPLIATFEFSLKMIKDRYTFEAYRVAFTDSKFFLNFGYSVLWAVLTMICSTLLVVPTAYWVHWKMPNARPYVEFVTLMPFVVPAVTLTYGLLSLYGSPPIVLIGSPILLIAGYIVLSLPYMFRAVDTGLRAIDVRTLTEAALSLGAGWGTILTQVIFPNLRVAILSGIFLTFAIVMGEFTFASLLSWPAFGPYLEEIGSMRAYTPQALSVVSFMLTWISIGLLQLIGRGRGQEQVAGAH